MKKTALCFFAFFVFTAAFARLPDLIPFRKGDLWGYCDSNKRMIIPCQFTEAGTFDYIDSARGRNDEGQSGYIMKNGDFHPDQADYSDYGHIIVSWYPQNIAWTFLLYQPEGYDSCDYFFQKYDNNLGLIGFEDCHHRLVIPCRYSQTNGFSEGLAAVADVEGNWSYIDKKGNTVFGFEKCIAANSFVNGLAVVSFYTGTGLINKKGEFIIPPLFVSVEAYSNLIICSHGDYGPFFIYDKTGKWLYGKTFSQYVTGDDGSFLLEEDSRFSFIDQKGRIIPGGYYPQASAFREGMAAVADSGGYWGFINAKGQMKINTVYAQAYPFSHGLAAVSDSSGYWGFIDRTGQMRIPFRYEQPVNESGFDIYGLCKIGDQGYLDFRGTEYWEE